jgi:hypothetical protein
VNAISQSIVPDAESSGLVPSDIADLLTSGWTGGELEKRLHAYFPNARRGDVYFAIGIAACLWKADLAIAELETRMLRDQIADGEGAPQ